MTRRYETLRRGGYPYLVAENRWRTLGYAYAGPYRARPAYHWSVEDSIYYRSAVASPRHRPRTDRAADRGGGSGRVPADDRGDRGFRQRGSIELHRAAGFRMVGTFDNVGFKFGRWLDSVLMQRPLGAGSTTDP
jgi:phosphinothricin acetyltransferase